MKMKIKILKDTEFSFTGNNVLKLIMNEDIPYIDLLVRESVQNSADAGLKNVNYVNINYNIGTFNSIDFENLLPENSEFEFDSSNKGNTFLTICDSNTTGLLGGYKKDSKYKNFYNLVYDIMNDGNKDSLAGGSWGIGKSVYYRFGAGFVVFYTRTYEDGAYIEKLAMTFIENETKSNPTIKLKNSRGIAFFGDLDREGISMPIYAGEDIEKILDVFNEKRFSNNETGTKIIIPYLNTSLFIDKSINNEKNWWDLDLENNLEIALQRWYFPRIDNPLYKGKYLKLFINYNEIILCENFKLFQKLYNGNLDGMEKVPISNKIPNVEWGNLYLKKFSAEEMFMCPPYNYPSPLSFFDISEYKLNPNVIISYVRKPGMIMNYGKEWNIDSIPENEYLIGFFVLNDEAEVKGEKLGQYIRSTEKADHINWNDINNSDLPILTSTKPVGKIYNKIYSYLKKTYKTEEIEILLSSCSKLRKKLGQMLLPPSGFGDGAGVTKVVGGIKPKKATSKNKCNIYFKGFEDGLLTFETNTFLNPGDKLDFNFYIKSGSKKFSFKEWIGMGFDLPCKLEKLKVENIVIGRTSYPGKGNYKFEDLIGKIKTINKSFQFTFNKDGHNDCCGLTLKNVNSDNLDCSISFSIYIEPIDNTYSISIDSNFIKKDGGKK